MNNAIKRNQSQSNIELDVISDKLNSILISLNPKWKTLVYDDKVVEDEAHKFDGITYENLTLSNAISGKIKHNNELIDKIMDLLTNGVSEEVVVEEPEIVNTPEPEIVEEKEDELPPVSVKRAKGFQKKVKSENE